MQIPYLSHNWKKITYNLLSVKTGYYTVLVELYNSPQRYYHNLNHIKNLLQLSEKYKDLLQFPDAIQFAIWYHDAIYDISRTDNEQKSAELCKQHLTLLGVDKKTTSSCCNMILATKTHQLTPELDSFDYEFFLDIDLSILAAPRQLYIEYTEQIRKEYASYTNSEYSIGRKKLLKNFLNSQRIYKTGLFFQLWEEKARENLNYEMYSL